MYYVLAGVVVVAVVSAVGIMRMAAPPSEPPDFADDRPVPAADGYVSTTQSILIGVPRGEFLTWINNPDLELSDLVEANDDFPSVADTEIIWGAWDPEAGRAGDRRRVEFENGHYLAEEVLEDTADNFRYMIWGFTNLQQRMPIRYAVAEFQYATEDGQTRLTWTYSFQPTVGLVRPMLRGFVDGAMTTMMRDSLDAWREQAEAELS